MGWSVGFDTNWQRDIGYGVPSRCDHPGCGEEIHRGLAYVCGGEAYGGGHGCGLFFCDRHLAYLSIEGVEGASPQLCTRCIDRLTDESVKPYTPSPDLPEWLEWKLTDASWATWREKHPDEVAKIAQVCGQ